METIFINPELNEKEIIMNNAGWVIHKPLHITPPKFNMEPENDGFQEELPFLGSSFQVPC